MQAQDQIDHRSAANRGTRMEGSCRALAQRRRGPDSSSRGQVLVIVVCNEGYSSSLAAATLHQLGLTRATDLIGGFQAWKDFVTPLSSG